MEIRLSITVVSVVFRLTYADLSCLPVIAALT